MINSHAISSKLMWVLIHYSTDKSTPQVEHGDGLPGAQNYLVAHLGGLVQNGSELLTSSSTYRRCLRYGAESVQDHPLRSRCEFPSCNGWLCS